MSPHFFFFTNYFKRTSFSLSKVKHTAQHSLSLSHTHTLSLSLTHTHTHTHLQTHLSTQIAGPGLVGFELLSDNGEVDLMGGKTCEIDIYTNKGLYFTSSKLLQYFTKECKNYCPSQKNFWAEWWTNMPENSIFSGPITHLLSMLCVFTKILVQVSAKKQTKRRKNKSFKFRTFIGRFQLTSWQWMGLNWMTVWKKSTHIFKILAPPKEKQK